ncbi:MAG: PhzF family phenazine biosynthesis protein [Thermoanaerobaculia bacterium]
MTNPIYTVDAFADRPFAGNPAAVCPLSEPVSEAWMQSVAREMNLSETAFLSPGDGAFDLRWFTPAFEVDLCGHATLASAHVLWETGRVAHDQVIRFSTRSGILSAEKHGDRIRMEFPSDPPRRAEVPEGLSAALGAEIVWFGRGTSYEFVRVADERVLRSLAPDFRTLAGLSPVGVCVTCEGQSDAHDFVSRFFAPSAGIDEDPVTGSAHCLLGPYWAEQLGKSRMDAYQASERGGEVRVAIAGDRVAIEGTAITISRGELCLETRSC